MPEDALILSEIAVLSGHFTESHYYSINNNINDHLSIIIDSNNNIYLVVVLSTVFGADQR